MLAQKVLQNGQSGFANLLGLQFIMAVLFNPIRLRVIALAPYRLQDPLGPFDLLHGCGDGFPAFGQIGNIADEKSTDAFAIEDRLEQQDDRLFVGEPTLAKRLSQEGMTYSE